MYFRMAVTRHQVLQIADIAASNRLRGAGMMSGAHRAARAGDAGSGDEGDDVTDDAFGDSASHVSFSHTFAAPPGAALRRRAAGGAAARPALAVGARVTYLGKNALAGVRACVHGGVRPCVCVRACVRVRVR